MLFDSQKDIYAVKKNDEDLRSQIFWSVMRTTQAACVINEPDVTWENENPLFEMEARNFTDMYKSDYIKEDLVQKLVLLIIFINLIITL